MHIKIFNFFVFCVRHCLHRVGFQCCVWVCCWMRSYKLAHVAWTLCYALRSCKLAHHALTMCYTLRSCELAHHAWTMCYTLRSCKLAHHAWTLCYTLRSCKLTESCVVHKTLGHNVVLLSGKLEARSFHRARDVVWCSLRSFKLAYTILFYLYIYTYVYIYIQRHRMNRENDLS